MGLFSRKKKEQEQPTAYAKDWDFYLTNIDNAPGSVMLDLGLKKIAPLADKPHLVWVSVNIKNPDENGLPRNEESETLYAIEDNLVNSLTKQHAAIYIGRMTSAGKRDFFFYVGNTTLHDDTISKAMVQFPTYEYNYGSYEDKNWKAYLDNMYPDPKQLESILNARVIRNLQKNGDNLTSARMVDHWINFNTKEDRENYLSEVIKLGFQLLSRQDRKDPDGYDINIGRVDKIDPKTVNEYVWQLHVLAEKHNGYYDGWGCTVVKE